MTPIGKGQTWERGGTLWKVRTLSSTGKTIYLRDFDPSTGLYGSRSIVVRAETLRRDFAAR